MNDRLYYKKDENNKDILTDVSGEAQVMMEWEKPYMGALVEKLNPSGDVLEIGFGMGYSASAIQEFDINSHTIIESDEGVLKKLKEWAPLQKHKVNIIEGCWQYHLPSMTQKFDSFFFDDFPHPEYPHPNTMRSGYFYQLIVQKNVKRGAKFTWFCSEPFFGWPCSHCMKWEMYEFVINEDISESITRGGYKNPEQIISRKKMYIPFITFNADSSEMGNYVFNLQYPHMF
jgi:hypothetical protein